MNTAVDDGLQTRLFMRRPWLYDLPELPVLPQGYTWRVYQPGDLPALAVLLTRAFEDGWDDERVRREVTTAPGVDAVYVMTHQDDMVAMASARVMPEVYPGSGYLDRVAVTPAYQGRGLGRRASIGVLRHFRQAGLRDAVLETDDDRLVAVRTFLRLGFVPEYRYGERGEQRRWALVLARLVSPDLLGEW